MTETVSLLAVQARWAYSEIINSNFSAHYENQPFTSLYRDQLDVLRAKRLSSLPFENLTLQERYWLAFMCWSLRPNLMIFMTGVEHFCERHLNKTDLAALLVPPMVSNIPVFMPFENYISDLKPIVSRAVVTPRFSRCCTARAPRSRA
jgi:hypothetical protein